MRNLKLLLDTNVIVDYLDGREPYFASTRKMMILGLIGEFQLWTTSTQVTDLIYILTDGGKPALVPDVLDRLRHLRSFVEIHATTVPEIDRMLSTSWHDPEDALLYEAALELNANFIITRNTKDFEGKRIPALNCDQLFEYIKETHNIEYSETEL